MEHVDSSNAIASLQADYVDSEDEDEDASLPIDNISDEETAAHMQKLLPVFPAVMQDEGSNHSGASLLAGEEIKVAKRATKLVSYGPDDQDEDLSESDDNETDIHNQMIMGPLDVADASALSRSVQNKSFDEIEIPPEPSKKCSKEVQDKIFRNYEKWLTGNKDLNATIQWRKDFRNPSIYEKLIDFCHIDEKGTNFPPEIFDPHIWTKDSFYDELDKAQKKEMEKREKERKDRTKIEFLSATKKTSTEPVGGPEEKKRKSKWDPIPNPSSMNLTKSATGTKTTVIHAVGNIAKKTETKSSQK